MARAPKSVKLKDIETEPDAWPRFERFIKEVAKAGPQHRQASKGAVPKPRPNQKRS